MLRLLIAMAAGALVTVVLAPAAVAKEGVRARLEAPIPVQAAPGEKIAAAWSLYSPDRRPFGAGGVFIRLLSATDGKPVKAHGRGSGGRFVATVEVPEGGIGGVEIGLEGTRYFAGRSEDADILFPIDRDPFAVAAAEEVSGAADDGGNGPSSLWFVAGGSAAVMAASLLAFRRQQRTRVD